VNTSLSIVIPSYQETARLGRTLGEILPFLDQHYPDFELLIVDDPGKDGSYTEIEARFASDKRIQLLKQPQRLGKGAAVKRGLTQSCGGVVLFMDADHTTPITEVTHFISQVQSPDYPLIVGGVRAYQEDENKNRRIIGLCAQLLFHVVIFSKAVPDSQCGFKLFTRAAIDKIIPLSKTDSGMIDAELFFLAQRLDVKCRFEPVRWTNKAGSKISVLKCIFVDAAEIFKIRIRAIFGRYHFPAQSVPLGSLQQTTS